MAYNYKGGALTLSATFQVVNSLNGMVRQFIIRSASGNALVELSADGASVCGFLNAGEAREFRNTPPAAVYVRGTAGNTLYWDVSE